MTDKIPSITQGNAVAYVATICHSIAADLDLIAFIIERVNEHRETMNSVNRHVEVKRLAGVLQKSFAGADIATLREGTLGLLNSLDEVLKQSLAKLPEVQKEVAEIRAALGETPEENTP